MQNLNLPAIELGDSDSLNLGDRISIFGYPGIGGETVTYTSGNVSGFGGEPGVRESRAWIKTDATIAGGNSGGTAGDAAGRGGCTSGRLSGKVFLTQEQVITISKGEWICL